ncbi:MAG: sulfatase [Gemmatimonadetes bacterium]|nr:sulfatase [Gemmatimonadota bacterium]
MRLGSTVRSLILALGAGLAIGAAEVLLVQVALRGGVNVRLSADYVWMAPLANVVVAVGLVAGLLLAARFKTGWDPAGAIVATLTALGITSIAFYYESLHKAAVLLLAAGLGSQAARLARVPALRRWFALVPVTTVALAGWIGITSARLVGSTARQEATTIAGLPSPPAGAPNVLLLVLDTVRRLRSYSGLDSSAATPALDAFAARGTSFDLAIAPAPWTLPSHASFFTGRLPIELSTSLSDPLDDRYPTLAEFLAARGYLTAGFVGNLSFATRSSGLARGFAYYRDYDRSVGQIALSSSLGRAVLGAGWIRRTLGNHELANRRHARDVVSEFLAWHDGHRHRPFFAFLNLFDGHEPYFPEGRSGSSLWPGARWTNYEHVVGLEAGANAEVADKRSLTADQAAIHEQAYLRAAATAASEAAAMLGELERRGALDNTIVVIVSDHGEQTGQHRLFGHLNSLYLPAVHVPLAIVGPNVGRGVRVRHAVGLNDLPVTIAQLAGALDSPFPGRSLLDTTEANRVPVVSMLEGGYQKQAGYPIGQGREMFALTTTGHRYIRNADGSEELFDLRDGVAEASNRASAPGYAAILAALRLQLDSIIRSSRP